MMRSSWSAGPADIGIREVDDPVLVNPDDVIVDVRYAAICGSDLWPYRGLLPRHEPGSTGHEFLGVVSEVGETVSGFQVGDAVIAPFMYSDGICPECRRGLQSQCARGGLWGRDGVGAQTERIRVPFADTTLVALPWADAEIDDALAMRLLPLADVFATGYHGAVLAGVGPGDVVVVVGDGAVGLSAAIAAGMLGAGRVVLMGGNPQRLRVAAARGIETLRVFPTDVGAERLAEAFGDLIVDRVIEAVGMQAAFDTALDVVRVGGSVGFVGVPHGVDAIAPMRLFSKAVHLAGGTAPARHYLERFVAETRAGRLDVSVLIDRMLPFDAIKDGYEAMDTGESLKVVLRIR
ncbi:alcohol dehydrogenase catalytic domain-containing protein [Microbacterium sp.]|uniref:alcohol dehydrogenase catalytic domain-containing protein n=1 Tax=Microbacterium sp. TaxID=51671 RepID=UPI003A8C5276